MEDDIRAGSDPTMTPGWVPLDRDAGAEAIDPDKGHAGAAFAAADRVLALLPAAPPPVPFNEAALIRKVKELEDGLRFYQGKGGPTPTDASDREIERLKAKVLILDRVQKDRTRYWQRTERERARLEEALREARVASAKDRAELEAEVNHLACERDDRDRAAQTWMEAFHEQSDRAEAAEARLARAQEVIADMERHRDQARRDIADLASYLARAREALKAILDAEDQFRATLPPDWESDPVHDACEAARALADSEPAANKEPKP